jgi:hypothetical protein
MSGMGRPVKERHQNPETMLAAVTSANREKNPDRNHEDHPSQPLIDHAK